jgi:hypothetical protein
VLEIILPVTLISRAILMYVDTVAVGFVVYPLSFKDVSVNVPEFTMSASLIEFPMTLIFGAISPFLATKSMLHIA